MRFRRNPLPGVGWVSTGAGTGVSSSAARGRERVGLGLDGDVPTERNLTAPGRQRIVAASTAASAAAFERFRLLETWARASGRPRAGLRPVSTDWFTVALAVGRVPAGTNRDAANGEHEPPRRARNERPLSPFGRSPLRASRPSRASGRQDGPGASPAVKSWRPVSSAPNSGRSAAAPRASTLPVTTSAVKRSRYSRSRAIWWRET